MHVNSNPRSRTPLFCVAAAVLFAGALAAPAAVAQSVDDLLNPPKPDGPPKKTPRGGGSGGGGSGGGQGNPTADDFLISPTRTWTTAPAIQRFLQNLGYPAQLLRDRSGAAYLKFTMERKIVIVNLFACTRNAVPRCKVVQFNAGYRTNRPVGLEQLNAWNRRFRFTYAFRSPNSQTGFWLRMDVTFAGGMPPKLLSTMVRYFRINEGHFRKQIGWQP